MNHTVAGCECGAEPSSKDLGIEFQGIYDGILVFRCGTCGRHRPRFPESAGRLYRIAVEIIGGMEME